MGLYVYVLRHEYHLKVTKMMAIVLHSSNPNYRRIELDMDAAYDAWVASFVEGRLREVQLALDADAAAIVERDAARVVVDGILGAGEQGRGAERGNESTAESSVADEATSGLRGKTVSFSGRVVDAEVLQQQAVAAGMSVRCFRSRADMVVVGQRQGECTLAVAQASARGVPLITPGDFATAATAAVRADHARCAANAAAAAASGATGWPPPATLAVARPPAAAASKSKKMTHKRGKVNTEAQPCTLKPGVYVAGQSGRWQRPVTFGDAATLGADIAREAARIVTFLRDHTASGDELAVHAAVYVVRRVYARIENCGFLHCASQFSMWNPKW